jgi:hypothetical protein
MEREREEGWPSAAVPVREKKPGALPQLQSGRSLATTRTALRLFGRRQSPPEGKERPELLLHVVNQRWPGRRDGVDVDGRRPAAAGAGEEKKKKAASSSIFISSAAGSSSISACI